MPTLPPGPRFLLRHMHYLVLPPTSVFLGAVLVQGLGGVRLPTLAIVLAYLLSFPFFWLGYRAWRDVSIKRAAAARGAIVLPLAKLTKDIKFTGEEGYPRDFLFRLCEIWGHSFMLELYSVERLFTSEPEHIKAILATDFDSFEKGELFRDQMQSLLGVGVFNADNELWKFHRSMTRPFFSKDRISHFENFDRHATDALTQVKARMREGYAIDWQDLISRFTLDSATEFLFGKDVRSLSKGLPYPPTADVRHSQPEEDGFAAAFYEAQMASARRGRFQDVWGLTEFWKDRVIPYKAAIDKFINPILEDALRTKAEKATADVVDTKEVSEEDTLLSSLLKVTDDRDILHDEILNILLAGRDTTASTLTFAVYRLAEHPDILFRLRQEILSIVGPSRRPSYEDIRNMKYLRAVINETLRLYPPVPMNSRSAARDTVFPSTTTREPVFVPAGTTCIYSVFLMHRRKDLWGPDALKFDPNRFLDERVQKYLTPNPFIFLPFNAGPRICLGQQFAYNEVSFMLVRLLQQFSAIEFVPEVAPESMTPPGYTNSPGSDGTDRVWMGFHLTGYAKGGLWVKMTEATNE
ncbi:cytochrome P450 monooxygenase pc-2 [Dichomitus squalens]|uniref:Cytochrome P450 monooxygenase pc-2 n=1 Tax=Dichomitus squalens TaxID=114155 RepID=A0A4Q9NXQ1_9APHY|nr:cytochrome P450 monooxygenase pc-2 [Dichomitus squalens]TBU60624.1 cytochrome P450 monooxygenase pc-2 [Dichomitus squalens]